MNEHTMYNEHIYIYINIYIYIYCNPYIIGEDWV